MLGSNFECSAERAARTAVVSRTFEARGVSPRPGVAEFWEGRGLPRPLGAWLSRPAPSLKTTTAFR